MKKILSFIIPSYNCEQYLDKCIASFLDENVLGKLDIIIVNDGSTDGTEKIAQRYSGQYPQSIRYISQMNKGHGGALNTGCAAAIGKYLKVIDADDWVETENLVEFVEKLERCESDVVLTHHYTINISTKEIKKWKNYPKEFDKAYSFDEIMEDWKNFERSMTFHGITYNTEFYHKNQVPLSEHVFYEDHEFATIPCCYAKTITPFDLFIYDYRIGDVQQSVSDANQLKRISHVETVLKRFRIEYQTLKLDRKSGGSRYYCMKAQGILLSYITTVLLVEKDRKKGRKMGADMMEQFRKKMPLTYEYTIKQYKVFCLMNRLHINKQLWEKILHSKIYNTLRHKHDFD